MGRGDSKKQKVEKVKRGVIVNLKPNVYKYDHCARHSYLCDGVRKFLVNGYLICQKIKNMSIGAYSSMIESILPTSTSTVQRLLKSYKEEGDVLIPRPHQGIHGGPGFKEDKWGKVMLRQVREFVDLWIDANYIKGKAVTSNMIAAAINKEFKLELTGEYIIPILKRWGFNYRENKDKELSWEESEFISKEIRRYCEELTNARKPENGYKGVVYTDESFIYENDHFKYSCFKDRHQKIRVKSGGGGKRITIIHAGTKDGWVKGADLVQVVESHTEKKVNAILQDVHKGIKKEDYHWWFSANGYEKWFREQLIANLKGPHIIVMDNARVHCRTMDGFPTWSSMKKQQMIDFLQKYDPAALGRIHPLNLANLRPQVKDCWRRIRPDTWIQDYAKKHGGHKVIYTPAYRKEFQPIEHMWASVKGYVRKHHTNEMSLQNKLNNIPNGFEFAATHWANCVKHTDNLVDKILGTTTSKDLAKAIFNHELRDFYDDLDSESEDEESDDE